MHIIRNTDRDCLTSPATASSGAIANVRPIGLAAPRARQPWGRLLKAVLELAGDHAVLLAHVERDWTSATFSGSRHAISLCFTGPEAAEAGELFIAALPDHEFVIPRYLIADAQISTVDDVQLPERELVVEMQLLLLEQA